MSANPSLVSNALINVMKDFAKEVLRNKPQNIYQFSSTYFEKLLIERDGKLDKGYERFEKLEQYFTDHEKQRGIKPKGAVNKNQTIKGRGKLVRENKPQESGKTVSRKEVNPSKVEAHKKKSSVSKDEPASAAQKEFKTHRDISGKVTRKPTRRDGSIGESATPRVQTKGKSSKLQSSTSRESDGKPEEAKDKLKIKTTDVAGSDAKLVPVANVSGDQSSKTDGDQSSDKQPTTHTPESREPDEAENDTVVNINSGSDAKLVPLANVSGDQSSKTDGEQSRDKQPTTHTPESRESNEASKRKDAEPDEVETNTGVNINSESDAKLGLLANVSGDQSSKTDGEQGSDKQPTSHIPGSRESNEASKRKDAEPDEAEKDTSVSINSEVASERGESKDSTEEEQNIRTNADISENDTNHQDSTRDVVEDKKENISDKHPTADTQESKDPTPEISNILVHTDNANKEQDIVNHIQPDIQESIGLRQPEAGKEENDKSEKIKNEDEKVMSNGDKENTASQGPRAILETYGGASKEDTSLGIISKEGSEDANTQDSKDSSKDQTNIKDDGQDKEVTENSKEPTSDNLAQTAPQERKDASDEAASIQADVKNGNKDQMLCDNKTEGEKSDDKQPKTEIQESKSSSQEVLTSDSLSKSPTVSSSITSDDGEVSTSDTQMTLSKIPEESDISESETRNQGGKDTSSLSSSDKEPADNSNPQGKSGKIVTEEGVSSIEKTETKSEELKESGATNVVSTNGVAKEEVSDESNGDTVKPSESLIKSKDESLKGVVGQGNETAEQPSRSTKESVLNKSPSQDSMDRGSSVRQVAANTNTIQDESKNEITDTGTDVGSTASKDLVKAVGGPPDEGSLNDSNEPVIIKKVLNANEAKPISATSPRDKQEPENSSEQKNSDNSEKDLEETHEAGEPKQPDKMSEKLTDDSKTQNYKQIQTNNSSKMQETKSSRIPVLSGKKSSGGKRGNSIDGKGIEADDKGNLDNKPTETSETDDRIKVDTKQVLIVEGSQNKEVNDISEENKKDSDSTTTSETNIQSEGDLKPDEVLKDAETNNDKLQSIGKGSDGSTTSLVKLDEGVKTAGDAKDSDIGKTIQEPSTGDSSYTTDPVIDEGGRDSENVKNNEQKVLQSYKSYLENVNAIQVLNISEPRPEKDEATRIDERGTNPETVDTIENSKAIESNKPTDSNVECLQSEDDLAKIKTVTKTLASVPFKKEDSVDGNNEPEKSTKDSTDISPEEILSFTKVMLNQERIMSSQSREGAHTGKSTENETHREQVEGRNTFTPEEVLNMTQSMIKDEGMLSGKEMPVTQKNVTPISTANNGNTNHTDSKTEEPEIDAINDTKLTGSDNGLTALSDVEILDFTRTMLNEERKFSSKLVSESVIVPKTSATDSSAKDQKLVENVTEVESLSLGQKLVRTLEHAASTIEEKISNFLDRKDDESKPNAPSAPKEETSQTDSLADKDLKDQKQDAQTDYQLTASIDQSVEHPFAKTDSSSIVDKTAEVDDTVESLRLQQFGHSDTFDDMTDMTSMSDKNVNEKIEVKNETPRTLIESISLDSDNGSEKCDPNSKLEDFHVNGPLENFGQDNIGQTVREDFKENEDDKLNTAAVKIQKTYRGHIVRKQNKKDSSQPIANATDDSTSQGNEENGLGGQKPIWYIGVDPIVPSNSVEDQANHLEVPNRPDSGHESDKETYVGPIIVPHLEHMSSLKRVDSRDDLKSLHSEGTQDPTDDDFNVSQMALPLADSFHEDEKLSIQNVVPMYGAEIGDQNILETDSKSAKLDSKTEIEEEQAAIRIQKTYRGHIARRDHKEPQVSDTKKLDETEAALPKNEDSFNGKEDREDPKTKVMQLQGLTSIDVDHTGTEKAESRVMSPSNVALSTETEEKGSSGNENSNKNISEQVNEDEEAAAVIIQHQYRKHVASRTQRKEIDPVQERKLDDTTKIEMESQNESLTGKDNLSSLKGSSYPEAEENAALKIQKTYRGHVTRKQMNEKTGEATAVSGHEALESLGKDNTPAIERFCEGCSSPVSEKRKTIIPEEEAAIKIQKTYKGYATRKKLQKQSKVTSDEKDTTATASMFKSESLNAKENEAAAIKIQKAYRGHATRKSLIKQQNLPEDTSHNSIKLPGQINSSLETSKAIPVSEEVAAIQIQKTFRGYKTRKNLNQEQKPMLSAPKILKPQENEAERSGTASLGETDVSDAETVRIKSASTLHSLSFADHIEDHSVNLEKYLPSTEDYHNLNIILSGEKPKDKAISISPEPFDDQLIHKMDSIISVVVRIQSFARGYLTRQKVLNPKLLKFFSSSSENKSDSSGSLPDDSEKPLSRKFLPDKKYVSIKSDGSTDETNSRDTNSDENILKTIIDVKLERKPHLHPYNSSSGSGDATRAEDTLSTSNSTSNEESSKDDSFAVPPHEESLIARRMTLQRGDAVQGNSTPEDENGNSSTENLTIPSVGRRKSSPRLDKFRLGPRQRTMPVQIDSDVMRVIPKHLRKRIRSAEESRRLRAAHNFRR